MVIPTPNVKDIHYGLHWKELFFEFSRSNQSLGSEIIASKSYDKKLTVLACDFFVEHAASTAREMSHCLKS